MELTPSTPTGVILASDIRKLDDALRDFIGAELASNSTRGYRCDMRLFLRFCEEHDIAVVPRQAVEPETVARFLSWCALRGDKAATIVRRRAALRWAHTSANLTPPTGHPLVAKAMRGILRKVGRKQNKKAPILDKDLLAMLAAVDRSTLAGKRDYALMVVAFSGALRRSELVAIHAEHLRFDPAGIELTIPKSKTDQEGAGHAFAQLFRQMKRARQQYIDEQCQFLGKAQKSKRADMFCRGWLASVSKQVDMHAGGKDDEVIAAYMKKQHDDIGQLGSTDRHKGKRPTMAEAQAFVAGRDAGADAALHHGVNGNSAQQLELR